MHRKYDTWINYTLSIFAHIAVSSKYKALCEPSINKVLFFFHGKTIVCLPGKTNCLFLGGEQSSNTSRGQTFLTHKEVKHVHTQGGVGIFLYFVGWISLFPEGGRYFCIREELNKCAGDDGGYWCFQGKLLGVDKLWSTGSFLNIK